MKSPSSVINGFHGGIEANALAAVVMLLHLIEIAAISTANLNNRFWFARDRNELTNQVVIHWSVFVALEILIPFSGREGG
jgi:hypothetical protein